MFGVMFHLPLSAIHPSSVFFTTALCRSPFLNTFQTHFSRTSNDELMIPRRFRIIHGAGGESFLVIFAPPAEQYVNPSLRFLPHFYLSCQLFLNTFHSLRYKYNIWVLSSIFVCDATQTTSALTSPTDFGVDVSFHASRFVHIHG